MTLIIAIAVVLVTLIVWELAGDALWKDEVTSQFKRCVRESNFHVLENRQRGAKTQFNDLHEFR